MCFISKCEGANERDVYELRPEWKDPFPGNGMLILQPGLPNGLEDSSSEGTWCLCRWTRGGGG